MNNIEQLKEEAKKEFDKEFVLTNHNSIDYYDYIAEDVTPDIIKDFINSQIDKAYEAGKKEAIEKISIGEGWEESEEYYKELLLNK